MTAAIKAQLAALKPAEPTPVARTGSKSSSGAIQGQKPAFGEMDTPKERARPAGHRARYAVAQGGGLAYAGWRMVCDDLTDHQKDTLTRAAVSVGVHPYQQPLCLITPSPAKSSP